MQVTPNPVVALRYDRIRHDRKPSFSADVMDIDWQIVSGESRWVELNMDGALPLWACDAARRKKQLLQLL